MSEQRRLTKAARDAWSAVMNRLLRDGTRFEPWPEKEAPVSRAYSMPITTQGLSVDQTKELVAQAVFTLAPRVERERREVAQDAVVFVKEAPATRVSAGGVMVTAVLGYARRSA